MPRISLIRIDSPQERELDLHTGEICIGRGSILECDDKRVSRNHGLLQVSGDGSIALVSMHTNPCFYKVQDLKAYAVLKKGQSKILSHGDEFALLPNSFRYRVVIKPDTDLLPDELDGGTRVTANEISHTSTSQYEEVPKFKIESQEQVMTKDIHNIENSIPDSFSTTPSKRKRLLPRWLTNLSGNECSSSTVPVDIITHATATANKRRGSKVTENEEKKVKLEVKEVDVDLDSTAEVNVESEAVATELVTTNMHELSDDDNDVKPNTGCAKDGYEAEYGEASSTSPTTDPAPGISTNQNVTAGTPTRGPCMYGATCYRKNPQHRTDFSHPGDADFVINQNLPECPFGTSCYRKNLQHRTGYKHTQPPHLPPPPQANAVPSTRTRRRHTAANDDESEDDYDFNDPFLNDASSDDYQPTSSEETDMDEDDDDEESQERRRMLREAKKFTKKKKD